jgi:hypothetical protein
MTRLPCISTQYIPVQTHPNWNFQFSQYVTIVRMIDITETMGSMRSRSVFDLGLSNYRSVNILYQGLGMCTVSDVPSGSHIYRHTVLELVL